MEIKKETFILASLVNNMFCSGFNCIYTQTKVCICISKPYALHIFQTIAKLYDLNVVENVQSPSCQVNENCISYSKIGDIKNYEIQYTSEDPSFPFGLNNSPEFKLIIKILERIEYHSFDDDKQKIALVNLMLCFFGYKHLINPEEVDNSNCTRVSDLAKEYKNLYSKDSNGNIYRKNFSFHLNSEYMKTKISLINCSSKSDYIYLNFLKVIEKINTSNDMETENGHFFNTYLLRRKN